MEYGAGGTEAMPRKGLTWIRLSVYMNPSVRWGNGGPQQRGFLGGQWQVEQEPSSPAPILHWVRLRGYSRESGRRGDE